MTVLSTEFFESWSIYQPGRIRFDFIGIFSPKIHDCYDFHTQVKMDKHSALQELSSYGNKKNKNIFKLVSSEIIIIF